MAVGKPRAFVEMAAGERTQPIEMRLDMPEKRVGQMNAEQVAQGRIGAVEIHAGRIRGEQSRRLGRNCHVAMSVQLVHLQLLLFPRLLF
jgi:hypothetical protein